MGSTPSCSSARPTFCRMAAVDFAAGFRRVKVMRPAIGVEAHRQAMLRKDLVQRPEDRGRAFLFDEKGRVDRPRRVVEHDNEIERLALEPFMPGTVPRLRGGRL
jgi:hypothetical protein